MNLNEALSAVFEGGERVTRRAWANSSIYCCVHEKRLVIYGYAQEGDDPRLPHPWIVHEGDWFSDDWEILCDYA